MELNNKKFDELYNKIMKRLNRSVVESTDEVMSAYDVNEAIRNQLDIYNCILLNHEGSNIKAINRKSGYTKFTPASFEKRVPRVYKISAFVSENDMTSLRVVFAYGDGKYIGSIFIDENYKNENFGKLDGVFKNNTDIFDIYFSTLKSFTEEYPGISYSWDSESYSKYDQEIDDGFITSHFDLTNQNTSYCILSKVSDLETSRYHHPEYGELYDYISFYNTELMKKTPINIDELNPFIKGLVSHQIESEKQAKLSL